LLKYRQVYR